MSIDCNQGTNIKLFLELCCSKGLISLLFCDIMVKLLVIACTFQTPIVLVGSCQDPARQATATSDRVGLGRLWIGLNFRFSRSAHLLSSPTFHVVHTTRVLSQKTSFHCVHAFGHNLAFCMFILSNPTFYFRTSLLFYSDTRPYSRGTSFCVPLIFCSVLSFYSF